MDNAKTGLLIAQERKEHGLTQKNLSEMIGVSNATISKWETGRSRPDVDKLATLAQLFGVTEQELLHPLETKWSPSQRALLDAAGVMV